MHGEPGILFATCTTQLKNLDEDLYRNQFKGANLSGNPIQAGRNRIMKTMKAPSRCIHCHGTGTLFNDDFPCPCTEGIEGEELEVMVALARSLHNSLKDKSGTKVAENREALFNFLSKKEKHR